MGVLIIYTRRSLSLEREREHKIMNCLFYILEGMDGRRWMDDGWMGLFCIFVGRSVIKKMCHLEEVLSRKTHISWVTPLARVGVVRRTP